MSAKNEKIIVFDESGNPKELRYYEAEKLVARLGTILDTDSNFIGLRELDIEEVSPQSWFDRNIRKKQPQKRVDILTVDFIGLINWINTIKTIKNIENIVTIQNIDLISQINNIKRMRIVQQDNLISNGDFETGTLDEWEKDVADPDVSINLANIHGGTYSCALRGMGTASYIGQALNPFKTDDVLVSLWLLGDATDTIHVTVYYTDGTTDLLTQAVTAAWAIFVPTLDANKFLSYIRISHVDDTKWLYVDDVKLTRKSVTVSSLPALVASNVALGLGESATYDTIRVDTATSGQATLLAAQGTGVRIYVCGYQLQAQGDVMVSLRSATADISPEWDLNAREGVVCEPKAKPLFYCKTVANELLSINLDAAIRVTGNIQYYTGA